MRSPRLPGAVAVLSLVVGFAGVLFVGQGSLSGEAAPGLSPAPSFHVDIGSGSAASSTGNTYSEDPNSDSDAADQRMSVPTPFLRCVSRTVTDFTQPTQSLVFTDIVIQNAQEMVGVDIRINYDPARISLLSASMTPFTGGSTGQSVGLMNLPAPPYAPFSFSTHATAGPATNIDNTNGAAFLSGTYLGTRTFAQSTESGPAVDGATNTLPNRNAGHAPDGGVVFRVTWRLIDVSPAGVGPEDTADILLDLTTAGPSFTSGGAISAGSQFVTLTDEDPFQQAIITLGSDDLIDGLISVNKTSPVPCPPSSTGDPGAGTGIGSGATPGPGTAPGAGITPGAETGPGTGGDGMATAAATPAPNGDGSPSTATTTAESTPGGGASDPLDSDDAGGGGSGSDWVTPALVASLILLFLGGGALLWLNRRRIAWPWLNK